MYIKDTGNELASLRKKKGITLEELSDIVGIHKNTLSRYERDAQSMPLKTFEKILSIYGINEFIFFKRICDYNHDVTVQKQE